MQLPITDGGQKTKAQKNILDLLDSKILNQNPNTRIQACVAILRSLEEGQVSETELSEDVQYISERLVKGLLSSREAVRLGFNLLLGEILKLVEAVKIEYILSLIDKHHVTANYLDNRDVIFAKLFAYSAIVRSGRLANDDKLGAVVLALFDLWQGRYYILNACYEVICDLFSQLSKDAFKTKVFPELKEKLSVGWEEGSPDMLWFLVLCIRMFPNFAFKKYLQANWSTNEIFSEENYEHLKKYFKQTTASLPMLHPLCIEFVTYFNSTKDKAAWTTLIDENLMKGGLETAYVGFKLVGKIIETSPDEKALKIVMSPNFHAEFNKSLVKPRFMTPAAKQLAGILCKFAKESDNPEVQFLILTMFLQQPDKSFCDILLKTTEVTSIIQNLAPDAVKMYYEFLKTTIFTRNVESDEVEMYGDHKCCLAITQIGIVVNHPNTMKDTEWRLDVIKFLFLHSFFEVKGEHCDAEHSNQVRTIFKDSFFKALVTLCHSTEQYTLQNLMSLTDYVDQLLAGMEENKPCFPIEEVQDSWKQMRKTVRKLSKQKEDKSKENIAFNLLFLQLGFHLFNDSEYISELLGELQECCKKALHARKHTDIENESDEPSWIMVVVDILLSLLSKPSTHLRHTASSTFYHLCPFITEDALKQIISVVSSDKSEDESMLMEEDGAEFEPFSSGDESSADKPDESKDDDDESATDEPAESKDDDDESATDEPAESKDDDESDTDEPIESKDDDEFRKKVKLALGTAADDDESDAESVVLTDSEMFELDKTLAEVFKARMPQSRKKLNEEDRTMLNFKTKCLDLIEVYFRSQPPMHLALLCMKPLLDVYTSGNKSKHHEPLRNKIMCTIQALTKIKKFENHDDVKTDELKEILENLIDKCYKEKSPVNAKKFYSLCTFTVLCFRKLEQKESKNKKSKKTPVYVEVYLSALDGFLKGSSHMLPQLFVDIMTACQDISWYFLEFCEKAFENLRGYKQTQCLSIINEALRFSKSQQSITTKKWIKLGDRLMATFVKTLSQSIENSSLKPAFLTELLKGIDAVHTIVLEKTNKSPLENCPGLLPLLTDLDKGRGKKFLKKCNATRKKLMLALGGSLQLPVKLEDVKSKLSDSVVADEDASEEVSIDTESKSVKRKSMSKNKMSDSVVAFEAPLEESMDKESKSVKRKSMSKNKKSESIVADEDPLEVSMDTESKSVKRKSMSKNKKSDSIVAD